VEIAVVVSGVDNYLVEGRQSITISRSFVWHQSQQTGCIFLCLYASSISKL